MPLAFPPHRTIMTGGHLEHAFNPSDNNQMQRVQENFINTERSKSQLLAKASLTTKKSTQEQYSNLETVGDVLYAIQHIEIPGIFI